MKKAVLASGAVVISAVLSLGVRKCLQVASAKRAEQDFEEESL